MPKDGSTKPRATHSTQAKVCCNSSVGVLIEDPRGRLLMFTRPDGKGVAPVAGHIWDQHDSATAAAHAEVAEEVGLTVEDLEPVTRGWRYNRCKRLPGTHGYGHHWIIYRTTRWSGELTPSQRETRDVRWYTCNEITNLVDRTLDAATGPGTITRADWDASPGLEAVWVRWLIAAGTVAPIPADTLAQVEAFAVFGVPLT